MSGKDKLIVALDVETLAEANNLTAQLHDCVGMFKIGSQLFTNCGPSLVERIIAQGNRVFLDLKFHDIPHQVAGAARAAAELGVTLFTIHASGGSEMMKRAVDSVTELSQRKGTARSRVLAVSVLTSMDATTLAQIGMHDAPGTCVERLVKLAEAAGVDGVVASPHEARAVRSFTRPGFLVVTPGIRPDSGFPRKGGEDQKRIATPAYALKAGADYLVVGRPITSAPDRVAAAQAIISELDGAENDAEQANA